MKINITPEQGRIIGKVCVTVVSLAAGVGAGFIAYRLIKKAKDKKKDIEEEPKKDPIEDIVNEDTELETIEEEPTHLDDETLARFDAMRKESTDLETAVHDIISETTIKHNDGDEPVIVKKEKEPEVEIVYPEEENDDTDIRFTTEEAFYNAAQADREYLTHYADCVWCDETTGETMKYSTVANLISEDILRMIDGGNIADDWAYIYNPIKQKYIEVVQYERRYIDDNFEHELSRFADSIR